MSSTNVIDITSVISDEVHIRSLSIGSVEFFSPRSSKLFVDVNEIDCYLLLAAFLFFSNIISKYLWIPDLSNMCVCACVFSFALLPFLSHRIRQEIRAVNEAIPNFLAIVGDGVTRAQAQEILLGAGGNLEVALNHYFSRPPSAPEPKVYLANFSFS